jgi:tetratricopeptide (TPR) repeat protein
MVWWLWTKRHGWGRHALLGLGFFLINLAPCPGLIPDPANNMSFAWVMDHFLYLPIIGLIGLTVAALGRTENQLSAPFRACGIGLVTVVLALMAFASHGYAALYLNSKTLWTYELRHNPGAWLAHNNLGSALLAEGQVSQAIEECEAALQINPSFAEAHNNLGDALLQAGRISEAIRECTLSLQLNSGYAEAYYNLGNGLLLANRPAEAIIQYEAAIRIKPDYAEAHNNLGSAFGQTGQLSEAMKQFELAVQINPDYFEAHYNLGNFLRRTGHLPEAMEQYKEVLRIRPDYAAAQNNLARLQALPQALPPKN